jgi:RNA polymerase sigma factor (sigma-70 family)
MPAADVKDLAQDAFLVVLHKMRAQDHPPFATEDEERSWLYTITTFELKNYRRRARYRQTEAMDDYTNDFRNPRNDHARLEDRETLLLILESIGNEAGRQLFELVELEGFSVVQAAETLNLTERNAHHRLGLARQNVEAVVAKLRREEVAGGKKKSAFLMAFGVVPWVQLRSFQDPPAGTVEEIWARLQATVAKLDRENERSATPPAPGLHARPHAGRLLTTLAGPLKSPWFNVVSACLGGAIVALLFLLRPNTKLVPFQVPVPIFVVTSSPPASAPLLAPSSPPLTPPTDVTAPVDEAIDEEAELIRQARAAFATSNRKKMLEALTAYERRFPTGRLRNVARSMRANVPDAGAR